ncbi:diguanylate cyclase [Thiomicrorhabdus sp. zzn3]|uniref:transporter substrate-binding domain-containing diguanylate cyclase n=1 Tax=Thiomicrorhabdus sp. zzn3 TaxID=3039775 RepID=UPI0024373891|nr:diguanylate cyclase [Thiomicrorhabdus sp. zzn3]MDG6777107.1 diguanylate cyclase [Thiomicrorhabdus sp. zzn3]
MRFSFRPYLFQLIRFLFLLLLTSGTASAGHPENSLRPITVQINWNHQFQFAGLYAAIQQGYYQKAGMDVKIKSWRPGVRVAEEVASGQADFGVGYGSLVADYAQGKPISLVMASFQFSPMVLLSHEPIDSLSQLSGKTVMHFGNLQVFGLLNKARQLASEPIKEVESSGDLQDFIDHKVDYYAAFLTNEPYRLKRAGVPYYVLDPKSYGVQSYGDLIITSSQKAAMQPELVEAFKQATIQGWEYALTNPEKVVDFILQNYPVVKSRDALLAEAKATEIFVKTGEVPIGTVEVPKLMATAVSAKEVGLITQKELDHLDMEKFVFDKDRALFTEEERAYLASHPVIKLANDIDWEPFEFIDEQKRYRGIAADYFRLFSKKLGVHFEPVLEERWPEVVAMTQSGKLDVYSCAVATPERAEYMNFTQPYLSFPMMLAAKDEVSFIDDYSQLKGKVIAAVKGYWSEEYLKEHYPEIKVLSVNSVHEGLDAVIEGRAFGYIGNLAAINFAIRKYGAEGVRIVGQFGERFELAIGVRKDDQLLFSIMQKVLNMVTEEERQAIFNRWIKLEVVNKLDTRQLLQIVVPALLVIGALLFTLLFYIYQKRQQKRYIRQIQELSYATEIDLKNFEIIWSSRAFAKLSGYALDELVGMNYLRLAGGSISEEQLNQIYQRVKNGRSWHGEVEGKTKSGQSYWVDLTLTPKKNLLGQIRSVLATRIDVTDKKRIHLLSITDPLTGLYNRRYFNEVIERELKRAQRQHLSLSLAMIDIDYFKKVNDLYGHPHGDMVLKRVAATIQEAFNRADDFVFRVGGEEFMVVSSFENAMSFQEHLEMLRKHIEALGIEHEGASQGVITISAGGLYIQSAAQSSAEKVLQQVDQILYQAKSQGRNKVVVHS